MRQATFWSALISMPGQWGTQSKWRESMGPDFLSAQRFLAPRADLAHAVACRNTPRCACRHEVVEHSDGTREAYCRCHYHECEPFPVTCEDLVIYDLDERRFRDAVARGLGLGPVVPGALESGGQHCIGTYRPVPGRAFPLYIIVPPTDLWLEDAILGVFCDATKLDPPIILYVPGKPLSVPVVSVLEARRALYVPIGESLILEEKGIAPSEYYQTRLAEFRDTHCPAEHPREKSCIFPVPDGATWRDIQMHFPYTDTVVITAPGVTRTFTCHELGMGNSRTKKPAAIWDFFYDIAGNDGRIDYGVGDKRKNKDWKSQLSGHMRRIFGIEEDPFSYDDEETTWQAKLALSA